MMWDAVLNMASAPSFHPSMTTSITSGWSPLGQSIREAPPVTVKMSLTGQKSSVTQGNLRACALLSAPICLRSYLT